jgi:hypothetical protein
MAAQRPEDLLLFTGVWKSRSSARYARIRMTFSSSTRANRLPEIVRFGRRLSIEVGAQSSREFVIQPKRAGPVAESFEKAHGSAENSLIVPRMSHGAARPRAGLSESLVSFEGYCQRPRRRGRLLARQHPLVFNPVLELDTSGEIEARHEIPSIELEGARNVLMLDCRREFDGVAAYGAGSKRYFVVAADGENVCAERRTQLM